MNKKKTIDITINFPKKLKKINLFTNEEFFPASNLYIIIPAKNKAKVIAAPSMMLTKFAIFFKPKIK